MDVPNLDDMRLLAAVVEHGSFSRAAERCGTTQPRVSRAVGRLEARLGVALLRRSSRHVAATPAGERLANHARRLLDDVARVEAELQFPGGVAGPLSVSAPPAVGRRLLARPIERFAREHPGVCLSLALESRRVELIGAKVDVAIRFGPLQDSWQQARRLLVGAYHVYAAPNLELAEGCMPEALHTTRCLVLDATHLRDRWPFRRGRQVAWTDVDPYLRCDDVEMLLDLAVAGLGLVIVPDFLVRGEAERGRLVRLTRPAQAVRAEVFAVTDPQ